MIGIRRICTQCHRPVGWTEEREFFHMEDNSPLCEGGSVDLEAKKCD